MKYVSLTFDDGRGDNYIHAAPVMLKYGIKGTVFVTTGYVDGSWQSEWKSGGEAMTAGQLRELQSTGFEMGLHGDRHITEIGDFNTAYQKFLDWGLYADGGVGFSVPTSSASTETMQRFKDELFGSRIAYIRSGRRRKTSSFSSKSLFALYSYLKSQTAYNRFNSVNVERFDSLRADNLCSLVVRCQESPEMIINFLKNMPDNTLCVLMLHSILPQSSSLYGSDPWNYSKQDFEKICAFLNESDIQCDCLKNVLRSRHNVDF